MAFICDSLSPYSHHKVAGTSSSLRGGVVLQIRVTQDLNLNACLATKPSFFQTPMGRISVVVPEGTSLPLLPRGPCSSRSSGSELCSLLSTCLNPATQALGSPLHPRPPQVLCVPRSHSFPCVVPLPLARRSPSTGTLHARLIPRSQEAPCGCCS